MQDAMKKGAVGTDDCQSTCKDAVILSNILTVDTPFQMPPLCRHVVGRATIDSPGDRRLK